MPIEIERKFLLANEDWRLKSESKLRFVQGYLNSDKERTVRIRVAGDKGFLTIKGKTIKTTRLEFEYNIPLDEAMQLLTLCENPLIEKTRYLVKENGCTWEVDEFEGINKGLIIAEVELDSEDQEVLLPEWIGEEVSDDPRYYNANLVLYPFIEWTSHS